MESSSKIQTGLLGFVTLSVVVLSIVTMTVCVSLRSELQKISSDSVEAAAVNGTAAEDGAREESKGAAEGLPIYVLKGDSGGLTVLTPSGEALYTVDCPVGFLPSADREALGEGISVFSEEELAALIEDFTG